MWRRRRSVTMSGGYNSAGCRGLRAVLALIGVYQNAILFAGMEGVDYLSFTQSDGAKIATI